MEIERPIIIVGAPRSGTTLLFSILSSHPDLWSLYRESERIIGKHFHPQDSSWSRGDELGPGDVSEKVAATLRRQFYEEAQNYQSIFKNSYSKVYTSLLAERVRRKANQYLVSPLLKPESIRFVEKTPRNCLRIPLLDTVFPDAFYIFLARDPRPNISSLVEGWREPGRYETYQLPGGVDIESYNGAGWNFLLPPGWEDYSSGRRLEEICALQYRAANEAALDSLSRMPEDRWMPLKYEDLISYPESEVERLCDKTGLDYKGGARIMAEKMPPVNSASAPDDDKWKKNEVEVMSVIGMVEGVSRRMGYSV